MIRVNNSELMVHSVFCNDPGPIQRGLISGDKIQTPTLLYNTVLQGRTYQVGDVYLFLCHIIHIHIIYVLLPSTRTADEDPSVFRGSGSDFHEVGTPNTDQQPVYFFGSDPDPVFA